MSYGVVDGWSHWLLHLLISFCEMGWESWHEKAQSYVLDKIIYQENLAKYCEQGFLLYSTAFMYPSRGANDTFASIWNASRRDWIHAAWLRAWSDLHVVDGPIFVCYNSNSDSSIVICPSKMACCQWARVRLHNLFLTPCAVSVCVLAIWASLEAYKYDTVKPVYNDHLIPRWAPEGRDC